MIKPISLQTRRLFVVSILITVLPWPLLGVYWLKAAIELQAKEIANPNAVYWIRNSVAEAYEIAGSVSVLGLILFGVILFCVALSRLWGSSEDQPKA
ncbi:hypothetical protein [Pseudomonas fluorescens]|jgi:hypothetical protein|uniref:hypothetical protein n=1 Tax=Pseudomonas fluorescens TaxID=294 RepID=UPI00124139EB|nr:hypothetical protein [Pseudomonas fluorescens]VVN20473.1 hypothetical protein PS676_04277 [Pseudomonas fluorescens]